LGSARATRLANLRPDIIGGCEADAALVVGSAQHDAE